MLRAVGSKKNLFELPFYACISDIFENEEIQRLGNYTHHVYTTRLQHSLNVSYYNYLICKFLHLDAVSAARAGLMHDMFYYDRKDYDKSESDKSHSEMHSELALKNAKKQFYVDKLESDIIETHMWPMTIKKVPKYRESYVIVFVDKYCTVLEYTAPKFRKIKSMIKNKKVKAFI